MEKTFYYRTLHVESKKRFVNERKWISRLAFLEDLAKWNRQGDGVWVYWEIDVNTYNKEMREKALDELVEQAQELGMGY